MLRNPSSFPTTTIRNGTAEGRLVGGNLSVLVAMAGAEGGLFPMGLFDEAIIFLEGTQGCSSIQLRCDDPCPAPSPAEVGEKPYAIDRMLTTLHLAGAFKRAKGVVFGTCSQVRRPCDALSRIVSAPPYEPCS